MQTPLSLIPALAVWQWREYRHERELTVSANLAQLNGHITVEGDVDFSGTQTAELQQFVHGLRHL